MVLLPAPLGNLRVPVQIDLGEVLDRFRLTPHTLLEDWVAALGHLHERRSGQLASIGQRQNRMRPEGLPAPLAPVGAVAYEVGTASALAYPHTKVRKRPVVVFGALRGLGGDTPEESVSQILRRHGLVPDALSSQADHNDTAI